MLDHLFEFIKNKNENKKLHSNNTELLYNTSIVYKKININP